MSRLTSFFNLLRCVTIVGALLLTACAPQAGVNFKNEIDDDDLTEAGLSTPESETETPDEEETAEPEEEDELSKVEFAGEVSSLGPGEWVIDGQTVSVDADTEIEAGIVVGDAVKVEAMAQEDGSLVAFEIKMADEEDIADEADDDRDEGEDEDEVEDKEDEEELDEDEAEDEDDEDESDEEDDDSSGGEEDHGDSGSDD